MGFYNNFKRFFRHGFMPRLGFHGIGDLSHNYIKLEELTQTYKTVPEVAIVINRLASMCSNVNILVQQRNNEITNEHPALMLLKKPNPLQDQQELNTLVLA